MIVEVAWSPVESDGRGSVEVSHGLRNVDVSDG